jgi:fibronectin-binding autotransporter adhesin
MVQVRYSGTTANTYTGTTTINAGALQLNKTAGVDAIAAGGSVIVGDDLGGNNADVLGLAASNQINDSVSVDVRSSGNFNFNNNSETISGLILTTGLGFGASVNTGTGTLTLGGNVTVNNINAVTDDTQADINGLLNLGGATRTITVADATLVTTDLALNAAVSNGSIVKEGAGRADLGSTVVYSLGSVTINNGAFGFNATGGDGVTINTITVNNGGTGILLAGNKLQNLVDLTVNTGGTFNFNNLSDTIGNIAGGGDITNIATITLDDLAVNADFSGTIAGAGGLILRGQLTTGTQTLSGANPNTYAGNTTVNAGTLILNKTAGVNAIPGGTLTIGDSNGANDADVVRLDASNQIADGTNVAIATTGLFNLNGNSDTVGALTVTTGNGIASTINTGAGTLTLGGNVTVNNTNLLTDSTAVDINGNLNLGGATRTVTVTDATTLNPDINIAAAISNGGVVKAGTGQLEFSGAAANTYVGNTVINAGQLRLNKTAGTDAIAGGIIQIGDSAAGNDSDLLQLLASNQINDVVGVDIRNSGRSRTRHRSKCYN